MEVLATLVFVGMGLMLAVVMKQRNEMRAKVLEQAIMMVNAGDQWERENAAYEEKLQRGEMLFDFVYGQWQRVEPQAEDLTNAFIDMMVAHKGAAK